MFEKEGFSKWFKENTPKEGLSENTTFSRQFLIDAWNNGYDNGYNKTNEYAKTIIQDLLDNSDEYARERAINFLEEKK